MKQHINITFVVIIFTLIGLFVIYNPLMKEKSLELHQQIKQLQTENYQLRIRNANLLMINKYMPVLEQILPPISKDELSLLSEKLKQMKKGKLQ